MFQEKYQATKKINDLDNAILHSKCAILAGIPGNNLLSANPEYNFAILHELGNLYLKHFEQSVECQFQIRNTFPDTDINGFRWVPRFQLR